MRHTWSIFGPGLAVLLALAGSATAAEPGAAGTATQTTPASRPASEIVLVRVGDTVITQEDFNREVSRNQPAQVARIRAATLRSMIGQRLLNLYLQEHPELIDEDRVEKALKGLLEKEGVTTREELDARLVAQGTPGKLDLYLTRLRMMLGREEIVHRSLKSVEDEKALREIFDRDPRAFDGSRMYVRHIRVDTLPWDTPEQVQARRDKAERIRADLVSGRRTWEECVAESDSPSRVSQGELGYIARHLEEPEVVGEAAFRLQPGQTSEVVADRNAFHIVQVTKAHAGELPFEEAKLAIRHWMEWEPLIRIDEEMRKKHPIVGVREPDIPPPPASRPASDVDEEPSTQGLRKPPATRPGAAAGKPAGTRPGAAVRSPGTRPAMMNRPAGAQPTPAQRATPSPARPAGRPATQPARK